MLPRRAVRADVKLHGAEPIVEWYQENGPSVLAGNMLVHSSNSFRMDGFIALLVGQNVPYQRVHEPTVAEQEFWRRYRHELAAAARAGMNSEEVLRVLRTPGLEWGGPNEPLQRPAGAMKGRPGGAPARTGA